MTTHLWLVIDHNPDPDQRRPRELVICGPDVRPNEIVNVPLAYAENKYIGPQDDNPIYAWTARTARDMFQEREQRRKRGAE